MWDLLYSNYMVFLAIFTRMAGMLIFNPFFGRKNIPVIIKMGFAFFTTVILMGFLPPNTTVQAGNALTFMLICGKELLVGFAVGFIMQIFLSSLQVAGSFMDLQLGVGMANVYDPQSNISMALSATLLNLLYIVLFFVTNAHLTFLKIIFASFGILPLGDFVLNPQCGQYIVLLFADILILAIKLALPLVAIEIITELGLGILMRTVPQINIFMVGLQLKLLVGLFLLVLILPGVFDFFDAMTSMMFKSIQECLSSMA